MNKRFDPFATPNQPDKPKAGKAGKPTQQRRKPSVNAQEALERIQDNPSDANYAAVVAGFAARGIPTQDIHPKENVFTYAAWPAKGRQVNKGESSVKITTWIPIKSKEVEGEEPKKAGRRLKRCALFHISQTHPIDEPDTETTNRLKPSTKDLPSWLQ